MEQAIEVSVGLASPLGRLRQVLADEPGLLVAADAASADERRRRCFRGHLSLDLGSGTTVQHELMATFGLEQATENGVRLPVHWEPAGDEHLLPSFAGEFELTSGRPGTVMTLRGRYTVPLAAVGRLVDRLAGQRVAHRVLEAHVEATGRRLDEAVAHRVAEVRPRR